MKRSCYYKHLSHADLERVMDVCGSLHQTKPGESFLRHASAALNQAFDFMSLSIAVYRLKPFRLMEQKINTPEYDRWVDQFRKHVLDHPDRRFFITMIESGSAMTSLQCTTKEFHYSTLCTELDAKLHQMPCQLWIGIRDDDELLNCVYSHKNECTEEHMSIMCLLQSNLESAWKNWKRVSALEQEMTLLKNTNCRQEDEKAVAVQTRKAFDSLTDRQRDVVKQIALGKDNQQIAEELNISIMTVKTHLKTIFHSLHVHHRTELAAKWHAAYFIHLPN